MAFLAERESYYVKKIAYNYMRVITAGREKPKAGYVIVAIPFLGSKTFKTIYCVRHLHI